MSAQKSALAELVTQAPQDDLCTAPELNTPAETEAAAPPREKEGRPCRCFRFRRNPEPKLASVVPVVTEAPQTFTAAARLVPEPKKDRETCHAESSSAEPQRPAEAPPAEAPAPVPPAAAHRASAEAPELAPRHEAPSRRADLPPREARQQEAQLGPQSGANIGRKTLVLDLDETLVHSSFRVVPSADIVITVELDGDHHPVYVRKRPGVDAFMIAAAELYEVVVYTASMAKYANPLLDELDKENVISHRLFREACTRLGNGYVKDLSKLGRNLKDVIIIDNSPTCYALQPNNAIPIRTWREDPMDRELLDLVPILHSLAAVEDIPMVLQQIVCNED